MGAVIAVGTEYRRGSLTNNSTRGCRREGEVGDAGGLFQQWERPEGRVLPISAYEADPGQGIEMAEFVLKRFGQRLVSPSR